MTDGTILLLDDDASILSLVARALDSEGFEVRTANSSAELDALLQEIDPDVFLLDVNLPDDNGLRIAKTLHKTTDAGIILVTGVADSIDRIVALELGADDYITKPFNIRELRARVNAVFRRVVPLRRTREKPDRPGARATAARSVRLFHGLCLDLLSRRVSDANGLEIPLTTLEYEVLVALTAHPDTVLSREQIMDQIRGPDWAVYDRSIDGLISRVRKKLFPDGSGAQKIRTVRNIGYMLSLQS
jgi:DNA-binding response OmpR family regulator